MCTKSRLIILHIDFNTGSQECIIDNESIPECETDGVHPIDVCPHILTKYLDVEPDWVTFTLVDVGIQNNCTIIYYACLIPAIINNINGDWIDIGRITDGDIQKIVFDAGQKILARF